MNQLLSSKIWLFKWATFRHDLQNVTMIFFFKSRSYPTISQTVQDENQDTLQYKYNYG